MGGGDKTKPTKIREFLTYFNKIRFKVALILDNDMKKHVDQLIKEQLIQENYVYLLDPDLEGSFGLENVLLVWNQTLEEKGYQKLSLTKKEVLEEVKRGKKLFKALDDLTVGKNSDYINNKLSKKHFASRLADDCLKDKADDFWEIYEDAIAQWIRKVYSWCQENARFAKKNL